MAVLRKLVLRLFLKGYPLVKLCSDLATWIYQFLYVLGISDTYSPFMHLLNLKYCNVTPEDQVRPSASSPELNAV